MQTCTNCQTANPDTALYCHACAGPLRPALPPGTTLHGRFQIVRVLKRGQAGAVYQALDRVHDDCLVSVREGLDTSIEAKDRFLARAEALARASHPNLARVIDYFVDHSGKQYLVTDAYGHDLAETLEQGRLPAPQALSWLAQVCDGVTYLHGMDPPVVHGDIEPGSIRIGPDGQAVLGQYGLAVPTHDEPEEGPYAAHDPAPGFSPPEAYDGRSTLDARSDVYSLAATLYCLLTVHVPPSAPDRKAGHPLIPLAQANPAVSAELEAAIVRSLALDPAGRAQTATEFRVVLSPEVALVPTAEPVPLPATARPARPPAALPIVSPRLAGLSADAPYLAVPLAAGLPPVPSPFGANYNLAGFWSRFLAYMVDGFIVGMLQFCVLIVPIMLARGWLAAARESGGLLQPTVGGCLTFPLSMAVYFAYYTYFHGHSGQTPGKMLLGLRVVRTDGSALSYGGAFVRTIGYIISGLIFDLGFLWAAWDDHKQAWHDKLADTYVITV